MNTTLKKTLTALAMAALGAGATVGCGDKSSETPETEGTTGAEEAPEGTGGEEMPAPEDETGPMPEGETEPME